MQVWPVPGQMSCRTISHYYGRGWQQPATQLPSTVDPAQPSQAQKVPSHAEKGPSQDPDAAIQGHSQPQRSSTISNGTNGAAPSSRHCHPQDQQSRGEEQSSMLQDDPAAMREWEHWPQAADPEGVTEDCCTNKENARWPLTHALKVLSEGVRHAFRLGMGTTVLEGMLLSCGVVDKSRLHSKGKQDIWAYCMNVKQSVHELSFSQSH